MKKGMFKKRKLNNAGMTLIEVLVAMVILSCAVVPLMYSFVQIARYNLRGRDLQQTTVIAHTVMENCKAYNIDDIVTKVNNGSFLTGDYADGHNHFVKSIGGDAYEMYFTGLKVDNRNYGVSLKLAPITEAKKSVTEFESMNPLLDGVFQAGATSATTLPDGSIVTAVEFEEYAFEFIFGQIADAVNALLPPEITPITIGDIAYSLYADSSDDNENYQKLNVDRDITILASGAGTDEAKVQYTYSFDMTTDKFVYKFIEDGEVDPTEVDVPWTNATVNTGWITIYSNSANYGASYDGTTITPRLENVYLFYYPVYNSSTYAKYPCKNDTITVTNNLTEADGTTKKDLNVYIVKQKNPDMLDGQIYSAEASYDVRVKGTGTSKVQLFHNLEYNVSDGVTANTPWDESYNTITNKYPSNEQLIVSEEEKLMYTVAIEIFENATYDPTTNLMSGRKVLTLDGTKLNW